MLKLDIMQYCVPYIAKGVAVTLKFSILSLICGLPLGILLAMGKISNVYLFKKFSSIYTDILRGTPLLLQLGIIFYALPQITGYQISTFEAGVLAFSLNSAAYSSEIIRAGINAISQGQWEAARILGMSTAAIWLKIILPQAIRNIMPALINEMVNLLKESSLVSIIGEADILRKANAVAAEKYVYFEPLIVAALFYFIMVKIISFIGEQLEKRWSYVTM